jgi:hypothetical protein
LVETQDQRNDTTDISGNNNDNNAPTETPASFNPSIALVKQLRIRYEVKGDVIRSHLR